MDLVLCMMCSHSMTNSFFIWKMIYLLRKWLGITTYFSFLFLKGKQNNKENPKCDSLFGKGGMQKTKSRVGGQGSGYLLGRYDKDHNTPLSS